MEKINITELLKDCPKGMELDCTMYEDVYFDYVDELNIIHCYIQHGTHKTSITFNQHGTPNSDIKSKCVIFPKGKTTWEGFHKQFEDGDILISGLEDEDNIPFIFKQINGWGNAQCHCAINCYKELILNSDNWTPIQGCRLATPKEKEKLFDILKAKGYKWNAETKTLEKLIVPKFKIGDKIKKKGLDDCYTDEIADIVEPLYIFKDRIWQYYQCKNWQSIESVDKEYELVPNKFDISTLSPFDKVLVRDDNDENWAINWYGYYNKEDNIFRCIGNCDIGWEQCIPYEGNEHLLGTTNDCREYYKNW